MACLNTRYHFSLLVVLACFCVLNCQKLRENAPSSYSQSDDDTEPATAIPELHARQLWLKMDKDLKTAVGKIVKKVLPFLIKEIYQKDISAKCLSSLLQLASALKASKLWVYQLLDSSGRFPEGFLSGTVTSLGNYEECVKLKVNETKFKMQGQYCTLNLIPPVPAWKPFTSVHLTVPELFNISAPDTVSLKI
ncbi:uncharacterized protein LOC118182460 [Stegodyphus dumicola]|uniref:uncharacterized protein LOC118182460 n=1 Tax=Stegodyphus dumicola TaxID=202533 RepID=UPI0015AAEF1F|nr:uncharacterized protein LOC118182460 [Stegodyphus dumicola]